MKSLLFTLCFMVFVYSLSAQTKLKDSTADSSVSKQAPNSLMRIIEENERLRAELNEKSDSGAQSIKTLPANVSFSKEYITFVTTLAIWILSFTVVLIGLILLFLYKTEKRFGNLAFQLIGLIIVVSTGLLLIVTGYEKDQITPVIGLLGTIVGFIFGSNLNTKNDVPKEEKS